MVESIRLRHVVWSVVTFFLALARVRAASFQEPVARQLEDNDQVFHARDLLDDRLLRGPGYAIEDQVRLHDYRFLFYMKTSYGLLPVHGIPMLELRLREMHAIAAARELSDDPQVVEGVVQTLVNTPRGLGALLTEPSQSVRRATVGFRRMADRLTDSDDRQAGGPVRRQLAAELGCDPETRNPILDSMLDHVARRKAAGQLVTKAALGGAVPGLGLLALNAEQKEAIRTKTPTEINASIERGMIQIGVHPSFARRFRDEPGYTAMQRLIYWDQLRRLQKVPGFELLIERAIDLDGEARALSAIEELRLLNDLQRSDGVDGIGLFEIPLAVLHDGRQVLVCAADFVTDTSETRGAILAYRKHYPNVSTILLLSSRVSDSFRTSLEASDIKVIERPKLD